MAEPQPKVLELRVGDHVAGVDPDLQLHDVAARGRADQPGADARVQPVHGADVPRVLEVVDDGRVVRAHAPSKQAPSPHSFRHRDERAHSIPMLGADILSGLN